ncbi:tetratricopeptide repeat-containing sensor histidine kinase [Paenimyroides aestuarii]|uniref:histidine kinase n=1 Tax=Paenimyroides aestuarii TaxID=2968490 RepID=A0ABY5NT67_9FLAO|nr:tetratricopeptide repeat protein [Paenimyroides aestuarii]UUV21770.1 tetratricopeptide repeat protein [Paenimyroides aestuarii]
MKQTLLILLCFFVFSLNKALAQTSISKIDSLKVAYSNSKTDSAKAISLINLAIEYRFSNVDSTHYYQKKAEKLVGNNLHVTAHLKILKATLLRDAAQYNKALNELEPIIPKLLSKKEYKLVALSYRALANIYHQSGEYSKSIESHLKSIEYGKKINDRSFTAHAYVNMGFVYFDIGDYAKAIDLYKKALELFTDIGDEVNEIAARNNLSGAYAKTDEYTLSIEHAKKVLAYFEKTKQERFKSYPLVNLGLAYKGLKKYSLAEQYFLNAIKIKQTNADYKDMVITQTYLTELYLVQNKLEQAEKVAVAGYNLAEEKSMLPQLSDISYVLATVYKSKGDFKKANEFLEINKNLKERLAVTEKAKEIFRLQIKYETAEKENQILQQQAKLTNRNFWIFGLAALAVIIGLMGFLFYKQQVLKNLRQKRDNELKLALQQIENQNKLQEQRLSISRDLHDNIGAQLSFIISAIDTIKYYVKDQDENLIGRLSNIGSFAKETIQELRDTIWAMNKQGITIKDLESRIANFIEKAKQSQSDTQIEFQVADDVSEEEVFTGIQGLNIFRIIQEATNNAFKYADANRIEILISKENSALQFQVKDDGKGFEESEIEPGNGLLNMRKRALELNSELQMQSEMWKGTKVWFNVHNN